MSEDIIKIILDKLNRIEDKQDKTIEEVAQHKVHIEKLSDHEKRLSILEKNMYRILGAITIINIILNVAIAHFLK